MKLELKNIKVCKWASEETHCYQAVVYVNGKPAIEVSNEGHGGEDNQDPIETSKRDIVGEVNTWCENNLPKWEASDGEMLPTCLAIWCCDEVNKHLVQKAHKSSFNRNIKKKIMDEIKRLKSQCNGAPQFSIDASLPSLNVNFAIFYFIKDILALVGD